MITSITIPLRLVSEANSREHWSKKAKRHKQQRMLVRAYMNSHFLPELPLTITLTRAAPRNYDDDNLQSSFKFLRDEIADVFCGETISKKGLRVHGRNDASELITWKYNQVKTKDKEYFIVIELDNT